MPTVTQPTPEQMFRIRCYMNGVSNPEAVAELWKAEQVKKAGKGKGKKPRRPGRRR